MRQCRSVFLAATALVLLVAGCGSAENQGAVVPKVPRQIGPYKLKLVKAPPAALDGMDGEVLAGAYILRIGPRPDYPIEERSLRGGKWQVMAKFGACDGHAPRWGLLVVGGAGIVCPMPGSARVNIFVFYPPLSSERYQISFTTGEPVPTVLEGFALGSGILWWETRSPTLSGAAASGLASRIADQNLPVPAAIFTVGTTLLESVAEQLYAVTVKGAVSRLAIGPPGTVPALVPLGSIPYAPISAVDAKGEMWATASNSPNDETVKVVREIPGEPYAASFTVHGVSDLVGVGPGFVAYIPVPGRSGARRGEMDLYFPLLHRTLRIRGLTVRGSGWQHPITRMAPWEGYEGAIYLTLPHGPEELLITLNS